MVASFCSILPFHFVCDSASPISQTWMDMLREQQEPLEEMKAEEVRMEEK